MVDLPRNLKFLLFCRSEQNFTNQLFVHLLFTPFTIIKGLSLEIELNLLYRVLPE